MIINIFKKTYDYSFYKEVVLIIRLTVQFGRKKYYGWQKFKRDHWHNLKLPNISVKHRVIFTTVPFKSLTADGLIHVYLQKIFDRFQPVLILVLDKGLRGTIENRPSPSINGGSLKI